MGWRPHDLATFLAILALILMYSVSLVANLSTPMLRDWWAARSQASLIKRRSALLTQTDELRDVPMVDEGADLILKFVGVAIATVTFATHIVLGGIFLLLDSMRIIRGDFPRTAFFWILMWSNLGLGLRSVLRVKRARRRISPAVRSNMEKEIQRIEAKILPK
jgi:hypothetical protein